MRSPGCLQGISAAPHPSRRKTRGRSSRSLSMRGKERLMAEKKDEIFADKQKIKDFNFGEKTAAVFDDMLSRSVPFYGEMQRMIGEIAAEFAVEGSNVYDLGCSTCTTFIALDRQLKQG